MYFKKRLKVLKKVKEKGGITLREATKIYNSKASAYNVLNSMKESGLLDKSKAPKKEKKRGRPLKYVFTITEKSKKLLS